MPLKFIRNDITAVAADAMISSANPNPVVNPGTDAAIHNAAGPELLEARKAVGVVLPGSCADTAAFNLNAKYVLHAVVPDWEDGRHGEAAILRSAYDAALELAARLGCRSVASPLMGTGFHGFPRDVALRVAVQAFTDFLMDHDMTVWLVLFSSNSVGLAESLFGDLESYIDDHYVARRKEAEYRKSVRRKRRSGGPPEENCSADADEASMEMMSCERVMADAAPKSISLPDYLLQSESTFTEYLILLLRERTGKDSEVYKRAEVSKQLFSKILSNPYYQPKKNTAIQLAIGLQLDIGKTQKLLEKAGYALTRSSKADLIVQYCIERKIYSVALINLALHEHELPLLAKGGA